MTAVPNGNSKLTLWVGAAALLISVGGGIIQIGQLTQRIAAQDEQLRALEDKARRSIDDRSELRSDFEAQRRLVDGKFAEIETQFSAMNSFMNVEVAQRRQYDGVFFQKLFGQSLPDNAYYPTLHHEQASSFDGEK